MPTQRGKKSSTLRNYATLGIYNANIFPLLEVFFRQKSSRKEILDFELYGVHTENWYDHFSVKLPLIISPASTVRGSVQHIERL